MQLFRYFSFFAISLLIFSCKDEKKIYKKIETKSYFVEGYTYSNYSDKVFPNELVLIDKISKDTIYHCENCYKDFHLILEDTLLIYGGKKLDSVIAHGIILKKIPVPQGYKNNLPFSIK
ncbi:hypothetical protein [Chryseobacterium culicis]|uniref:hypothetical protein n=1 Tax=Chryseobacterium culicis TaxID=680127 RepID=UPI0018744AA0|nr:hypothetical protein [Chryseobacterium culicis]MBE4948321.1 hypothetical protein [Chryseobacterium culicis]